MKQVICISWGTKYGAPYINRLYGMVARNITPPFSFTCFTDSFEGIRSEIRCEPLPPIDIPMPTGTMGKWPKSRLWGERLADLTGPVLYLDLDLVITGSLDDFFAYGEPGDIVLARNQTTPFERLGQTSVFRFPVGKLVPLQQKFRADPQGVADAHQFEQRFVTRNAPGGIKLFPRRWVAHFRQDCLWPFPLNYALPARLPRDARIVIFPGGVHPAHAVAGQWGKTYPARGRLAHLRGIGARHERDSAFRYLRHYLLPVPWVARHWRE